MLPPSLARAAQASAAACLALASLPAAQTVVLEPSQDNVLIEESSGALSNGKGPALFAGRVNVTGGGEIRRAVLAFDVAGSVPAGSTILSASLQMTVNLVPVTTPWDFALHTLAAEDVLHVPQRPRAEPYDGQLFVTLRMLQLSGQRLQAEQISLFLLSFK